MENSSFVQLGACWLTDAFLTLRAGAAAVVGAEGRDGANFPTW